MTLTDCTTEFQAEIARLARYYNRSVEYIWRRWQNYERVSDVLGQSALLEDFERSLDRVA